jgi:hypothetical protein
MYQMLRYDETQEAIARIRMTINNYKQSLCDSQDPDETPVDPEEGAHWAFGVPVPGRLINSWALKETSKDLPAFRNFDFLLRQFISDTFPEEFIRYEDTITVMCSNDLNRCDELICLQIRQFKCVYISYQSLKDWRGARDILRCNCSFYGDERYDTVLVNMTDPGLHFARLRSLLRCELLSGRRIDVALVHMFKTSRWKPKTRWAGCQIRDEAKESSFLWMEHVVRGALLAPVSRAPNEPTHILVDTVDADMFLRADM